MKRVLYFFYYLKELDSKKFKSFMAYARKASGRSTLSLYLELFRDSVKYNISILEYFQFHFYEISPEEKAMWAGTGYMYEYQLLMNPKESRNLLSDKALFLKDYGKFVNHAFAGIEELKLKPELAKDLIEGRSDKVVLKSVDGQCGRGIQIIPVKGLNPSTLVSKLEASGNDLAEEFVQQHEDLNRLSPSGLNTLRIVTQINKEGGVDVIAARLRITVNNSVDNLAAGNLAAEVNLESGKVNGPAVYSDITKEDTATHPVTGVVISGFEVPLFKDSIEMVTEAALLYPQNRSIGWDVAITSNGPELIECNHDWCKLLWQLPVKKGLKPVLEAYRTNRK
tara:strand:- start:265 stop:1278 length:1014 start_codon:yes stop_codon:yes gene_type:complete